MSIINSDTLNTNWQLNMLRGIAGINTNTQTLQNILQQLIVISTSNPIPPQPRDMAVERVSIPWTNSALIYSISIANVGSADGLVKGCVIKPGEIFNFSADAVNNYFAVGIFNADGTGTELIISYIL